MWYVSYLLQLQKKLCFFYNDDDNVNEDATSSVDIDEDFFPQRFTLFLCFLYPDLYVI